MVLRWTKVDALLDSNRKIRKGGRNAREVYLFALRRHHALDRNDGRLPLVELEAWYVAEQLMMSEAEAQDGLDRAIAVNLLAVDGDMIAVVGWGDDWSRGPMNEADRKRLQRERAKESAKSPKEHKPCPDMSGHCPDTNVTVRTGHECHGSEERREEEIREREAPADLEPAVPEVAPLRLTPDSPAAPKASRKRPKTRFPTDWTPAFVKPPDGVDPDFEFTRWKNHCEAADVQWVDWQAAWRNWLANAFPRRGGAGPPDKPVPFVRAHKPFPS